MQLNMRPLNILTAVLLILALGNTVALVVYHLSSPTPKEFQLTERKNIVVLAPHQDDDVIMAGGLLQQNAEGENTIIYVTRQADPKITDIRNRDAVRAWKKVPNIRVKQIFLETLVEDGKWQYSEYEETVIQIRKILEEVTPDIFIIPLGESGQSDHDVINQLGKEASENLGYDVQILQASLYNPHFIARKTPSKILWFLLRLAPFTYYLDPNYGIDPSKQYRLKMSEAELNIKQDMLRTFSTELDTIPLNQFGFADLFDESNKEPDHGWIFFGKNFDSWSLISLLLWFAAIFSLGLLTGATRKLSISILISTITLVPIAFILGYKFRLFMEDFVYLFIFGSGCFVSVLIRSTLNIKTVRNNTHRSID